MKVTIVCDSCKWEKKNQRIKDWIKKPCPACGYKMINKADISAHRFFIFVKLISDIIVFFFPWKKKRSVHVSSANVHREFKNNQNN
jgi:predicted RNA-binding Zn-ribbon protein involved in translation (DUF1610 family)